MEVLTFCSIGHKHSESFQCEFCMCEFEKGIKMSVAIFILHKIFELYAALKQ